MMKKIQFVFILSLLSACGENTSQEVGALESQSVLESLWILEAVDGAKVSELDESKLLLTESEDFKPLSDDCQGIIVAEKREAQAVLLDAGLGSPSCRLHFLRSSPQLQLGVYLQEGMEIHLEPTSLELRSSDGKSFKFRKA